MQMEWALQVADEEGNEHERSGIVYSFVELQSAVKTAVLEIQEDVEAESEEE